MKKKAKSNANASVQVSSNSSTINIVHIFLLVAITALTYQLLMILHGANLELYATHTISPIYGHAWWRAFQNRLLSGFIIDNLYENKIVAYQIFIFCSLLLSNVLTYILYRKNVIPAFIVSFLFLTLQGRMFLYGWDFLDLIFMTTLLIFIDRKLNIWYFIGLFSVAIFNRESALFIAVWLIIDNYKKKEVIYGIALLLIGIIIIYLTRNMFISSLYPQIGLDEANKHIGNVESFFKNIVYIFKHYDSFDHSFSFVPSIMLISLIMCYKFKFEIFLLSCFVVLVTFVFGAIHEYRVWIEFIPFIVYMMRSKFL